MTNCRINSSCSYLYNYPYIYQICNAQNCLKKHLEQKVKNGLLSCFIDDSSLDKVSHFASATFSLKWRIIEINVNQTKITAMYKSVLIWLQVVKNDPYQLASILIPAQIKKTQ